MGENDEKNGFFTEFDMCFVGVSVERYGGGCACCFRKERGAS